MKYIAKQFSDFINESHHEINHIFQMKNDVSFFLGEVVSELGGRVIATNTIRLAQGTAPQGGWASVQTCQIKDVKFGILHHSSMHRTQFYIIAESTNIDKLLKTYWEQQVDLEDDKRVFTLKRRPVLNANLFTEIFPGQDEATIKGRLGAEIGISKDHIVAKKVQFGWRATQKTSKNAPSEEIFSKLPVWNELLGFGLEFTPATTIDMLKNGTFAFKVPVWAVEERYHGSEPRKMYAAKDLDYVGKLILGRKETTIRWWDFYTNRSKRLSWTGVGGHNCVTMKDYEAAFHKIIDIMREKPSSANLFPTFKFKAGWTENTLDDSRVDQTIVNAMDDMF